MTVEEAIANTMYLRQESLGLKLPRAVGVVGVGGVGSWLAYFLALAGVPKLMLWDHDTVSDHNLNRLPLTPSSIGLSKADAVADMILRHRPNIEISAYGKFVPKLVDAINVRKEMDWIIAGTDSLSSRQMVAKWASSPDGPLHYLEIAAEGEIGSVTGTPAEWATPDEANPGYQSVPVWVGPCVLAAATACAHILHSHPLDERVYRMGWENEKVEIKLL